ncbi:OsmC family protein [Psychrobacter sp. FDAARGOS_221]|uniref:OsmC family protein n=1 Tax=Psychrobacter sp. FDAARGOS_221 TaxID=1975705 RepID=UPI000BB536EA|nr:OsmC family protein [Psychrobacter sp. FDAARGOS_221]PNK61081.1 OsmC family peroxiredoxin [Psychrobacter sp. FDAARGOS_221]
MNTKLAQFEVNSKSEGKMRVDLDMRDLSMVLDEPADLGGTNQGASPVEAAVAALSGCVSIMISLVAKRQGVTVNAVDTKADLGLDMRGVMFVAETGNPFKTINLSVTLDADMTEQQLAEMQQEVRKYCPLHNLFTQAGTEIVEDWSLVTH